MRYRGKCTFTKEIFMTKNTEQQEGARLVQEWCALRDSINKASELRVQLEEEHSEKKRVFDTIFSDIEDRLADQKTALDNAKEKVGEAEAIRKDAYSLLKKTPKGSESYSQVKSEYDAARLAKKQAEEAKQQTQDVYDQALKPFEERLRVSRQAKDEAYGRLKEVKEELTKNTRQFQELSQRCFEHTNARELFDLEMTELVEASIDVRKKINLLTPVRDRAAEILRSFVSKNPTGWSTGAIEAAQRYLMWVNKAQTHGVILEDNPTYDYKPDDLVKLLGIAHIFEFVKVDKSKLESAAKAGELQGGEGQIITIEQLKEIRQKELGTPRLKAFSLGELAIGEVMITMAQELYEQDDTALERLGESGKLSKQTVTALGNAGITKASQLQRLSLHQLAKVYGIGEKRAIQIFRVLSKR